MAGDVVVVLVVQFQLWFQFWLWFWFAVRENGSCHPTQEGFGVVFLNGKPKPSRRVTE